jgi:uncharacterized surface anchored protein
VALLSAAAPSPLASPVVTPTPTPTATPTLSGTLQIRKTDQSGQPIPVAGVTFEVREMPGGRLVGQVMTGPDGIAVQRGLNPGRYCVKELTAPAGYQLAPTYTPQDGCGFVPAPNVVSAADPPTPTPSPTAIPSPTPSPTPPPTGELQITKTDPNNQTITMPGFTFNIHVGSVSGQVIATIATDGSGIAVAGALNPATYCVEETSAPDGYQVAPTYSPAACVAVASDPTQGHAPTIVTVIDPPAATPTPTAAGAADASPSPSATPHAAAQGPAPQAPSLPVAAVVRGLVGVGALLLLAGAVMIVVAIRRRRQPPSATPPTDYWYDSTIS